MAENKRTDGENAVGDPTPKKKSKRLPITIGVIVAIVAVAGAGFWVWHEQPSFCNAICHTPMDAYLPTYESETDQAGIDKYGNEVKNANAMLAPVHRQENGDTCLSCHVPTLGEQMSEGGAWITGSYEVIETKAGLQVPPEATLDQLVAARGVQPDEFCLNESCHNMTRDQLVEATSDMPFNPHVPNHEVASCGSCHKAHRASVFTCASCHNETELPDGWVTESEAKRLVPKG